MNFSVSSISPRFSGVRLKLAEDGQQLQVQIVSNNDLEGVEVNGERRDSYTATRISEIGDPDPGDGIYTFWSEHHPGWRNDTFDSVIQDSSMSNRQKEQAKGIIKGIRPRKPVLAYTDHSVTFTFTKPAVEE